jgi:hypothetical protein
LEKPGNRLLVSLEEALRRMVKSIDYESHLLDYVGVSKHDFNAHIERLWQPGMHWANYGYLSVGARACWSVDHIIPSSAYDHSSDADARRCWNLANLRPCWHSTNLTKSNRIEPTLVRDVPTSLWPIAWGGLIPDETD